MKFKCLIAGSGRLRARARQNLPGEAAIFAARGYQWGRVGS
jgi:hypothetical protein